MFRAVSTLCLILSLLAGPAFCAGGGTGESVPSVQGCSCCRIPAPPAEDAPIRQNEWHCNCLCHGAILTEDDIDLRYVAAAFYGIPVDPLHESAFLAAHMQPHRLERWPAARHAPTGRERCVVLASLLL